MMLEPPMNQLLKQVPSRYVLVNVVASGPARWPARRRMPGFRWTTSP